MEPKKRKIDFIIIGAMKSGTTSLFKYLSEHPQVSMAAGKETDFFSNDRNFSRGLNWYLQKYFGGFDERKMWGEASPQYMCFDFVPGRIYKIFPGVKLIAVLRNPIDRAYSHYLMARRQEKEKQSFEASIHRLIKRGRFLDREVDLYREFVMPGEYSRILKNYLKFFPKKNIKIVFTEDLAKSPQKVMREIFRFLGAREDFKSDIMGKRFHQAGEKRFPNLEKIIMKYKKYLKIFFPFKVQRALSFWFETKFNIRPSQPSPISLKMRNYLLDYYRGDVCLLKSLFKVNPPWKDFR